MESSRKNIVHLVAGGVGGTVGAVATCPLEVLKTRLQSSVTSFHTTSFTQQCHHFPTMTANLSAAHGAFTTPVQMIHQSSRRPLSLGIYLCLRHIVETEGVRGLFKGLGPNVVGVAPSRAIYFCTYARSKRMLNEVLPRDSPIVHIFSAMAAGFAASTVTNPIWLVKTRLQLDQKREGSLKCRDCIRRLYVENGLRGFYKGITASYFGITETVIHFVIYEALKVHLLQFSNHDRDSSSPWSSDLLRFMLAGAISKTFATCIAYPHEVARTRLRQEGNKYRTFVQTLMTVFKEEGSRALYSGLGTQLVRQIPNTALMMATYEAVVHLLAQYE